MPDELSRRPDDQPQELKFEIVDENEGPRRATPTHADEAEPLPTDIIRRTFDAMIRQRVLKWIKRTLIIGGILTFLALEAKWMRTVLVLYLVFALLSLAATLVMWRKVRKHATSLQNMFNPGGRGPWGM